MKGRKRNAPKNKARASKTPRSKRQARKPRSKPTKTRNLAVTKSRFSDAGTARFRNHPQTLDYVKALEDPFFAPAPKLGIGTFAPTSKHTIWFENTAITIGALETCFAVASVPSISAPAKTYTSTVATTLLSGATQVVYPATNSALINTLAQTGRVINWAVRVKVRAAATALPGTLGGIYFPNETRSNVETPSFSGMTSLSGYRPFSSSSTGQIGGEVQYRPIDMTSFEFYGFIVNPALIGGSTNTPTCLIVGTGWAAGTYSVEVSVVGHFETLGGADAAGEADSEPDLVDGGATIDSISTAIAKTGEPIRTSLEALMALDETSNHIARMRRARSLGGMISNFSNVSTSVTATNSELTARLKLLEEKLSKLTTDDNTSEFGEECKDSTSLDAPQIVLSRSMFDILSKRN